MTQKTNFNFVHLFLIIKVLLCCVCSLLPLTVFYFSAFHSAAFLFQKILSVLIVGCKVRKTMSIKHNLLREHLTTGLNWLTASQ